MGKLRGGGGGGVSAISSFLAVEIGPMVPLLHKLGRLQSVKLHLCHNAQLFDLDSDVL